MGDLGLSSTFGVGAMQQSVRQRIAEQLMRQQQDFQNQLQQTASDRADRSLALQEQEHAATLAERQQQAAVGNAAKLAPDLPMDQNVSPMAAGILRTGGMGGQLYTPPTQGDTASGKPFDPTTANPAMNLGTPVQQEGARKMRLRGVLLSDPSLTARDRLNLQAEDAGLKPLEKQGNPSGAEDDQKYEGIVQRQAMRKPISPDEAAFVTAYEKRKTLGPAASSSYADKRMGEQQDFQIQQAGRAELTNNVEKPFRDAQAQASELRDIVTAAQAGNKFAASQQSLMGALATIRSAGLNRLPVTEVAAAQGAGSLWDHIQGLLGKQVAGEPMSADLQKDLVDYAKVLDHAATQKYRKGFDAITKRYKLTDERPIAGDSVKMKAPNGQVSDVPADQVDHFKALGAVVLP